MHLITSRVPINKPIRPTDEVIMMNNDETYDEIMMKLGQTASNCLANMKGCWDLEVEPSVEEIEEYQ